jgi:hypothetical protein
MEKETLTPEEQAQKDFWVGVIVAIAGNLCISISFQVWPQPCNCDRWRPFRTILGKIHGWHRKP